MTRPSDDAVRDATGRDWPAWFDEIREAEAGATWDHKRLVAQLGSFPGVSGWWRQMIATEYEKAEGRRAVGQTADGAFQVGASRTMAAPVETLWALLVGDGLDLWLAGAEIDNLQEGATFRTDDGATGEVRVVVPHDRIRLTWHPEGWDRHSTLQLRLTASGEDRTVVGFHHERLPDTDAREDMRRRWKAALDRIARTADA